MGLQWSHVHSNVETIRRNASHGPSASRFNGATFTRTWKLRKAVLNEICTIGFNGATFTRTWKRRGHRRRHHCAAGFNGATFTRTWKPFLGVGLGSSLGASMEPRSLERGNTDLLIRQAVKGLLQWSHVHSNVETRQESVRDLATERGFNGATFTRTWKQGHFNLLSTQERRASMEPRSLERGNFKRERQLSIQRQASMEPRSLERGNHTPTAYDCLLAGLLQWSHVHSNVETRLHPRRFRPHPRFNGATFTRTWKPCLQ